MRADPSARELPNGATALHFAAQNGRLDIVNSLLEHGADTGAKDREDMTALGVAWLREHQNIVRAIIHHRPDINNDLAICMTAYRAYHQRSLDSGFTGGRKGFSVEIATVFPPRLVLPLVPDEDRGCVGEKLHTVLRLLQEAAVRNYIPGSCIPREVLQFEETLGRWSFGSEALRNARVAGPSVPYIMDHAFAVLSVPDITDHAVFPNLAAGDTEAHSTTPIISNRTWSSQRADRLRKNLAQGVKSLPSGPSRAHDSRAGATKTAVTFPELIPGYIAPSRNGESAATWQSFRKQSAREEKEMLSGQQGPTADGPRKRTNGRRRWRPLEL